VDPRIQNVAGGPLPGAVVSLGPGVVAPVVVSTDANGDLASSLGLYRDSQATFQTAAAITSPAANGIIASITPGTAGLYEVTGLISVTGTTAAATDSNNFKLNQSATGVVNPIPYACEGATGGVGTIPVPPVVLNLLGTDSVSLRAVAAATTGAVYAALIIARRVG